MPIENVTPENYEQRIANIRHYGLALLSKASPSQEKDQAIVRLHETLFWIEKALA